MKYLSDYMETSQTKAFEDAEAFFAFGWSQFEEQRKEGVNYVNMGWGLICPKENAQKLREELDDIYNRAIDQDVQENGAEGIINREYFNHECQISGGAETCKENLAGYIDRHPKLFTDEVIIKVCKESFNEAVEKDWF